MKILRKSTLISSIIFLFLACNSVSEKNTLAINSEFKKETKVTKSRKLSEDFKKYWYDGTAEITSYQLSQERYGELREGTSVTVFVTEDFLPKAQVKADSNSEENIPVLKLNTIKKFITGIYPYSIMTSTFSPLNTNSHPVKISHSMQEWCGQVYVQLNNKTNFEVVSHSYFDGEADQKINLPKSWLENELWNLIRINPEELPTGDLNVLPSFEYFRMSHQKMTAHPAIAHLVKGDSISTYTLSFPDLKREVKIYFSSNFPYTIERWEETHANGLTTTAKKMKRLKTAYWGQNSNAHLRLRDSLGL